MVKPRICAVFGCSNRGNQNKGVSFFRFPSLLTRHTRDQKLLSEERRRVWKARIKRSDLTDEKCGRAKVCSEHFISGAPSKLEDINDPDWAPCRNLEQRKPKPISLGLFANGGERYELRAIEPRRAEQEAAIGLNIPNEQQDVLECTISKDVLASLGCRTLHTVEDTKVQTKQSIEHATKHTKRPTTNATTQTELTHTDWTLLDEELRRANLEIYSLRKRLHDAEVSERSFEGKDAKTSFYTGLPKFTTLMSVFESVEPLIQGTTNSRLTKFQKLILTLMKLRLNLPLRDLAYRFQISDATASRVFASCLDVLYKFMQDTVDDPERDRIPKTMPLVLHFADKKLSGKEQLSVMDVEPLENKPTAPTDRVTAALRHKYTILEGQLPENDSCAPMDKIVSVCCALMNLSEPKSRHKNITE